METDPAEHLSDGLLLTRATPRQRLALGAREAHQEAYLLGEVGMPDTEPAASAILHKNGTRAILTRLDGPPHLLNRLLREVCDLLRAEGALTLEASADLPTALAHAAGLQHPLPL